MLVFKGFHNVVVAVKDVEAAAASWQTMLGGTPMEQGDYPGSPADVRSMRFGVGDAWVELAQPLSERSPLWDFLQASGPGVYSVGVQVDNVSTAVQKARQVGAGVLGDGSQSGPTFMDPKSLNGVLLGLHSEKVRVEGQPLFDSFHHIVVAVRDDAAAIADWQRAFGTIPHPEGPNREVHPHHIPVGEAWFGLTSAGTDAGALGKFLDNRGEGVYLISVIVDNVKQAAGAIRDRGGRIIGDENGPGQVFVHPATTHGVLMELADSSIRMWPDAP